MMIGEYSGVATLKKTRALNADKYRNGINRQIAAVSGPLETLVDEGTQQEVNSDKHLGSSQDSLTNQSASQIN